MTPEPIIEEPEDNASSNGIALSGNNAAQELAVVNASGKIDLPASIKALPVPERLAQVQSNFGLLEVVTGGISGFVKMGIDCYQNNKNRESYNQESIRYNETVRQLAQKQVDIVKEQCSTIRKNFSELCDANVKIHKQNCETRVAEIEKDAKNRDLEINKNMELELERIQQNALTQNLQIQADVQKDEKRLNTELQMHYFSESAKVEKCRIEQSTELAKVKATVEETKSKNEMKFKTLQENNALKVRKMEAEERKHERELEQERIKSNERLRALELLLGMNANRRDSANDPGTSSSSSSSSPQNENSSPPLFQSILIICYYNRNDSALHCRLFEISAENSLCGVANYLLTSDESQSLSNAQIDNSTSKLIKIPDNMNAQEFISILCALEGPPLDDFEGVSESNTIDISMINGYCHQINVHFG